MITVSILDIKFLKQKYNTTKPAMIDDRLYDDLGINQFFDLEKR